MISFSRNLLGLRRIVRNSPQPNHKRRGKINPELATLFIYYYFCKNIFFMEKERFKKLSKLVKVTTDDNDLRRCLPYVDALGKGWREKVKRELGEYYKEPLLKKITYPLWLSLFDEDALFCWHTPLVKKIAARAMLRIWFTTQMFWRLVTILAGIVLLLSVFIHWVIPIIGVAIWILFESYDSATHAYRGYSN